MNIREPLELFKVDNSETLPRTLRTGYRLLAFAGLSEVVTNTLSGEAMNGAAEVSRAAGGALGLGGALAVGFTVLFRGFEVLDQRILDHIAQQEAKRQ